MDDTLPACGERAARNEAAFRNLNENLVKQLRATASDTAGFVCECSASTCRRLVDLTPEEYRAVRQDSMCFFVVPGHERVDVEDVVEEHDGYFVVRKHEELAAVVDAEQGRPAERGSAPNR